MKTYVLFSFVVFAFLFSASAKVLVQDGVPINPNTGGYSDKNGHQSMKEMNTTHAKILGFTDKWLAGTDVVYTDKSTGLAFPIEFGEVVKTMGSGSFIINNSGRTSSGTATKDDLRHQYRRLSSNLNLETGTKLYFRFLMNLDSRALEALATDQDYLTEINNYGAGLIHEPSSMRYDVHPLTCTDYIWVYFMRNKAGKAVLRCSVGGTDKESQAMVLDASPTMGNTYLCVVEITVGKDSAEETLRAFAVDVTKAWDADNIPWVATNTKGEACRIDVINDKAVDFIFGGYYNTGGNFKVDEVMVATVLSDVVKVNSLLEVNAEKPSDIEGDGATLSAAVTLIGYDPASVTLKYGTDPDNLSETKTLDPISASGTVSTTLTGLQAATAYYYQWIITARETTQKSAVASFESAGGVRFSPVTIGGHPSTGGTTATVTLLETGLSTTTVKCYVKTDGGDEKLIATWEDVVAGAELTATHKEAAFGTTDSFVFKASFDYGGSVHEYVTEPQKLVISDKDYWKTSVKAGAWTDGANWELNTPPNEALSAYIYDVKASSWAEDAALKAKTLRVVNGEMTLDLRGVSTLETGSMTLGTDKSGESRGAPGTLSLTGGVVTVTGSVSVPEWRKRCSNSRLNLTGTTMNIDGALNLTSNDDSGTNNDASLKADSILTMNGLTISYWSHLYMDHSVVTNKGKFELATNTKEGTIKLSNGSFFRQNYNSTCGMGGKSKATLLILDSTFDASGNTFGLGGIGDGGTASSSLAMTNGIFKATAIKVPTSADFKGWQMMYVSGADSIVQLSGDFTLGKSGRAEGASVVYLDGGTVSVGGTLKIGDDARANRFNVDGAEAQVTAATLSYNQQASTKFTLPKTGFAHPVFATTGDLTFPAAGLDTKLRIDATKCTSGAWQTLYQAGGEIKNFTTDLVTVTGTYKNRPSELKLVKNAEDKLVKVLFRVKTGGLVVFLR